MRIAIVEDNADVRAQLCGFVKQYAAESGTPLEVEPFPDGSAITPYRGGFDVIFMDIEMPRQGGMDTAARIRAVDQNVVLVFVTNMAQYAIRGYEVDALDFVLKPVNYYQFRVKLERAIRRAERRGHAQVTIQTGGELRALNTDEIYYLETHNRMLYYHTADEVLPVRDSMRSAEQRLTPFHFVRCNQCYLVNLKHIKAVQDEFVVVGKERLAICLGVILLPLLALGWNLGNTAPYFLASRLMSLLWGVATVRYCVELDWTASAYCSIWILLTAEVIYELWQFLLSLLVGAGGGGGRWHVPGRSHAEMADRRSAA